MKYNFAPHLLTLMFLFSLTLSAKGGTYDLVENIRYRDSDDAYVKERCVLDLYYPKEEKDFATFIWFHGGGLKDGHKEVPERLKKQGIAVVSATYRFYPKVKTSDCIDDAAATVAWVFKNIESYGGSAQKIVVSGHSAGGYLAAMVVLDKSWLEEYGIDADRVAGVVPYSGHMITHMTVREEAGISPMQAVVDRFAPLYHVRKDAPPILLLTGDREKEMLGRYEENAYMWRMLKVAGHPDATLYELQGYGHDTREAGHPLALEFVKRVTEGK